MYIKIKQYTDYGEKKLQHALLMNFIFCLYTKKSSVCCTPYIRKAFSNQSTNKLDKTSRWDVFFFFCVYNTLHHK